MRDPMTVQLSELLDEGDARAVLGEISGSFARSHGERLFIPVTALAVRVESLFHGSFPGYHACDTDYHDYRHTLSVFLAAGRLLDGRVPVHGALESGLARDLLLAALCHDTGYIRKRGEEGGTGARFTAAHVERSARFALEHGPSFGWSDEGSRRVARIIMATGLKGEFSAQEWASDEEREAGAMLASADLIGQMADRAYLEKLLFLYYEFREAGIPGYDTEFDVLRKTIGFYEMTTGLLDGPLGGVRAYAIEHFARRLGVRRDLYAEAMGRQMDYLCLILADDSTNFRKKLKRLDLETVGARS